jgi:hypothetical protein
MCLCLHLLDLLKYSRNLTGIPMDKDNWIKFYDGNCEYFSTISIDGAPFSCEESLTLSKTDQSTYNSINSSVNE